MCTSLLDADHFDLRRAAHTMGSPGSPLWRFVRGWAEDGWHRIIEVSSKASDDENLSATIPSLQGIAAHHNMLLGMPKRYDNVAWHSFTEVSGTECRMPRKSKERQSREAREGHLMQSRRAGQKHWGRKLQRSRTPTLPDGNRARTARPMSQISTAQHLLHDR